MSQATKEWVLNAGEELRFEVSFKNTIEVRLKSGYAEYFGAELGREAVYRLSGENGAIFSWQGCTLAITGTCESAYVADETPMDAYTNVHMALQQLRIQARNEQNPNAAPRVMIVGPEDSGKTCIARILCNYAVRMDERPMFASLDPMEALTTMPCTVSVQRVSTVIGMESGFMGFASASSHGVAETPLVWQFGHSQPERNVGLFNTLIDRMATSLERRAKVEDSYAGIIVDTHGFNDTTNTTIEHAIQALRINTLLVVGNERMYSVYSQRLGLHLTVLKLVRSGGTVDRSATYRQQLNSRTVRRYFYGTESERVSSFSTVVNFQEIKILRVGEDAVAPTSTLPLGEDRKLTDTTVLVVEPDESLIHSILAVTDASLDSMDVDDAENIVGAQAVGFISVTKVEMDKQRMIVLSPVPGRLPKQVLLYGNAKWMETV
ncbi:Cleavage polyadenylation factor subunit clp1 [Coemansia sp. RSA 518]|nr:Cleavage polyadenylation factor subunit clp1 [Coemansia sp. RSA 532]KAJ2228876.1 Cleavage polyadenylation factor subunit clp1 [Coemansia sp. RSA 518]KAJ2284419.1 Cleavage polyadenylation factor subunit clp1 [Coemansia sp. RSA 370]KAJ2293002.1 Cleavage polyadenylation factor subunit clp1 [Coemansia sp. RSA 355]KAJ2410495.1 Cleavage polyadenylation factor subunit clp1 [Coemansia sp. RSA 2526]KAJ2555573.1 Cleavage polyadenylation factor subunit clp1 [Coemansia sp. RSA 1878]